MRNQWTDELDETLRNYWQQKMKSSEVAERMGISVFAVRGRAAILGIKFRRPPSYGGFGSKNGSHVAADERSAELLRAAGVRI